MNGINDSHCEVGALLFHRQIAFSLSIVKNQKQHEIEDESISRL
jgi:hypothetical protein